MQRSQSVYRPTRPLPPLSYLWEESSDGSLSDTESQPQPRNPVKSNRKASLCLPRNSVDISLSPATLKRLSERKHLVFPAPPKQSPSPLPVATPSSLGRTRIASDPSSPSRSGHIEALPRGSSTTDSVMEHPADKGRPAEADELADNIQQLIRETDNAFKSVGSAPVDLPTMSSLPATPNGTTAKTTMSPAFGRPSICTDGPPQTVLRNSSSITSPSLKSPIRTASKVKRTKSRKSKKTKANVTSLSARVSRWALGENVTDILKGNFLRKIEADEMLTPERLEVVRASKEYQLRQNASRETLSTADTDDDSETPVDAFHLQDLPARIGSSGVDTGIQTLPTPDRPIRCDFSLPKKKITRSTEQDTTQEELAAPTLPPKNSARPVLKSTYVSQPLPTIPEVFAPKTPTPKQEPSAWYSPIVDDEAIYFQSTPYTMNMQTFRHGRIFLPKPDVPRCMSIDDTLDWTAFQMAILGGAGDFISGSSDFTHRDEDGLDDLSAWFDEFGFEHAGSLVSAGTTPMGSPRSMHPRGESGEYSSASSSTTDPDVDLPIPVAHEFPHGFWNEGSVDASRFAPGNGKCKIKRWTLEGPPKRPGNNRDSSGSLPQSPMMDLVFVGEGDEADLVPMGYNLGHDLGDFLRWENQAMFSYGQE
ncbi:hypothetical protein F5X68DRAFT_158335 [Plectosphaerella plurivora]|uniref:Uncharacterized protein n=1 Tax=Plectosphaerella plurivora TaxID=936078 RepID=A0A9P8V3Y9_9PEZI|nr:hypothetical protein F5X68DRAFT_158335 [Plectosphaerella plurivora]